MVFERIICDVDATPECLEAVRQAARLAPEDAKLLLASTVDQTALVAPEVLWIPLAELEEAARADLERAHAEVADHRSVETRLLSGPPLPALLRLVEEEQATLLALGAHAESRALRLLFGSVTAALVHEAPCSLLVARTAADPERFPRSIVVGVDGSATSQAALEAARELAGRLGADLRAVLACGGKKIDAHAVRDAVASSGPAVELVEDPAKPVDALVHAAADLLVIGSHGVHGLRPFGSVSERVADRAACSVLVVRGARLDPRP